MHETGRARGGRRVLILAPHSSYRIGPYLAAAQGLGLRPFLVSTGTQVPLPAGVEGVRVDPRDETAARTRVLEALGGDRPCAAVATDDPMVPLAASLADELGLPHNPPAAARLARRKDLARARLAEAGLPVPAHRVLDLDRPLGPQLRGLDYPCVAKPVALAGSRGVIRADGPAHLEGACARIGRILAGEPHLTDEERRRVLVERFVPGPELALEGLLSDGRLEVLALFDKPDPLEGPFFEETYYVMPSRLPAAAQRRIAEVVEAGCAAYGLRHGPVHAEVRWHSGEAWILEIAARTIGGECARLLRFGTGHGLETLVLAHAAGAPLALERPDEAAGVLMLPTPEAGVLRRVEGVLAAQRVPGVEAVEIALREGSTLVPLPEGASYLGFVFARGPDPATVEAALRAAHARLRVVVAPSWGLRPREAAGF